tara:strand:+ start:3008 stop:3193 length:186 start_codon:yes stop_codon:yes gene_type:complete
MEGTELTLLITACSGALISVIVALQKSKCSSINCGFGCIKCIREVNNDKKNNSTNDNIEQV